MFLALRGAVAAEEPLAVALPRCGASRCSPGSAAAALTPLCCAVVFTSDARKLEHVLRRLPAVRALRA